MVALKSRAYYQVNAINRTPEAIVKDKPNSASYGYRTQVKPTAFQIIWRLCGSHKAFYFRRSYIDQTKSTTSSRLVQQ